ncbi:hypothetical protein PR202_gb07313 [Eleusine coracana subsp. coracana]|uniref:Uncharacterized protein n=1 Tax=Eleusine coracana subsp. coracana TaxID=191504 RepID=A0AAV5EBS6_ELECO|nr:hypothetical protein PR202_gb07313 [Eleusine coracana subsp. coracana]
MSAFLGCARNQISAFRTSREGFLAVEDGVAHGGVGVAVAPVLARRRAGDAARGRRAGVVVAVPASALPPPGRGASDRALRHSGARKRRYLSSSLLVAISVLVLERREPLHDAEAGVLCAEWKNAGDEAEVEMPAMPLGSSPGRRRSSTAPARSGRPESLSDVHRMENSSAGSMSMKDAVELLNDSPRTTSRCSKDGATRALDRSHPPPREKLSLRDGDGEAFSMV